MDHQPSLSASSALTQQAAIHSGGDSTKHHHMRGPGAAMADTEHALAPQRGGARYHAALAAHNAAASDSGSPSLPLGGGRGCEEDEGGVGEREGMQRLTTALTAVLSSGMASDFVQGLRPVLQDGKLVISTHIKLPADPEPVFIGMFPNVPDAVAAQKEAQKSVDGLPPHLARSLIAAQLAHTDPAGAAAAAAAVAHADDADADASGGQMSGCVGVGQQAPERLQSNSNSDNTAVVTSQPRRTQGSGAGAGALGTDGQGDAATPDAATGPGAMSTPPAGGEQAAATAPAAGVQGRGSGPAPQAAPGGGPSGTAGGPQLLPTVSGDMLRSLLSKGRHALSAAHQQAGEQGSSWQAPLLAGHQQMHSELLALLGDALDEPISNALGALGAAPAAAAAAATTASGGARNTSAPAAGAHQQQPPHQHMRAADASGGAAGGMMLPAGYQFTTTANGHHMAGAGAFRGQQQQQQQEQQQQQQQQAVYNAAGSEFNGSNSNLPLPLPMPLLRRGSSSLGGPPSPLTALLGSSQGLAGAAAAAQGELPSWALNGSSQGLGGGGLRPMSAAMLAASHSQHNLNLLGGDFDGPDAFTMMGHMAPAPGTTNNGAGSGNVYHHLMQMSGPAMPAAARGSVGGGDAYGSGINGGAAGSGVHASLLHMYGDGYMRGQAAAQAAPPGYTAADVAAAAAAAHAAAAAAAAAGSGSGSQGGAVAGVGDKRRRGSGAGAGMGTAGSSSSGGGGAPDPRMACVKSVQYRVSRFPSELHDLCIEHWERARCARVVCNDVQGVLSVQSGRCVVTFNQGSSEVVKGVADYLRHAGEERIKKWRRHVRMVDFPRPNNRTGELMTAEEFLCIVGFQSEQGGGKRARGNDA